MGKAVIERKKIEEFRIRSLAEVEGDLKEYDGWDGAARLGCVAFRLNGEGKVYQSILHLVGSTECSNPHPQVPSVLDSNRRLRIKDISTIFSLTNINILA